MPRPRQSLQGGRGQEHARDLQRQLRGPPHETVLPQEIPALEIFSHGQINGPQRATAPGLQVQINSLISRARKISRIFSLLTRSVYSYRYWQECQFIADLLSAHLPSDYKVDTDQVHRLIGILEVNAYEIYGTIDRGHRALYPLASLLSHRCTPNVAAAYSSAPFNRTSYALVDIKKGQEIFSSYANPLTCTLTRRPRLLEAWFFDCACPRYNNNTWYTTILCYL